ncbi:YibE/F family protein [Prosthecochloris sp. SCSIO W1101]|uniref:YibE/F family protein n=1 Tax=Prosthecochloris sp. SCSIO W1101 TaxID=2992242 RepID=UPI00223D8E0C|nr:YibE/F family protein [Prosthecochloris sp. SCSIO W1101]UZJ40936.1 YibE/F family protein [Prosthecochloris sp. SCSIO W1101]
MFFKKADIYFVVFVVVASVFLWFLPTGFEKPELQKNTLRERGKVVTVDDSDLKRVGLVLTGEQKMEIEILSGEFKGRSMVASNILMGQMSVDKLFREGDDILAVLKIDGKTGEIINARAAEHYRLDIELILFALFGLFLIGYARWTGFRALLSFVFTALAIWKVLIPLFLKGIPPLPIAFLIVSVTTSVVMLLITGFTRKGAVALSGAISGVGVTTVLAILFGAWFRVPGTVKDFAEMLLYSGFYSLNLTGIFLSGIFISAAGAVMDIAMDIAASQAEIVEKHPGVSRRELVVSGFRVGQSVIGTMTTTLLFAYSGSFTFVLMVFMAQGTPMEYIFNVSYVAAEILLTLVGSFGLVLVAPLTAVLGGFIYTARR